MQAITVVPYHPSNVAVYPFGHDLSLCLAEPFLSLFMKKSTCCDLLRIEWLCSYDFIEN